MWFLRLIRFPNLILIGLTQFLFYFNLTSVSPNEASWVLLSVIILSTMLITAGGYIINDYFDLKIDSVNERKGLVVGFKISRRKALVIYVFVSVIGLLLGVYVSVYLGILQILAVIVLWYYSGKLKTKLLVGNLIVSLLTSLVILTLLIPFQLKIAEVLTYSGFAFFINFIREIIKDLEDAKGDASFGRKTVPISLGLRSTLLLLKILVGIFALAILIILGLHYSNYYLLLYGLLALLIPLIFLFKMILKADTKPKFTQMSFLVKLIMLSGILSIFLINF